MFAAFEQYGREVQMHLSGVSLAMFGVLTAGVALGQRSEPQNRRQPGVIEKWSAELLESADHKVEAAEHALRIMEELQQRRLAPGQDLENLAPDQWPSAYAEVLARQAATLRSETGPMLRPYVSAPRVGDFPVERTPTARSAYRPHQWEAMIRQLLKTEGLPAELLAVPLVESGFNPSAVSPKGARGLWQLMPETARRFGLRVDAVLDERIDPLRSTMAAISYLKELYGSLGNWPLALAAYNAGPGRVIGAIQRGAPTFTSMAARGLLPEETVRYVPLVLGTSDATPFPTPPTGQKDSQGDK